MFTKLKTYKKFDKEIITIQQLYDIVKNNPQKQYIEYIRGLEYKSPEYKKSKINVNCIMPHGVFNGIGNSNLINFSNYLYYDIDGIDTLQELNDTIKKLNDTFPISFLQRSVSNKGFHFLIKIDDTLLQPNDTFFFTGVYSYVRQLLLDKDFNIDMAASGISRKMLLSSDEDCILNDNLTLNIDKDLLNDFIRLRNSDGKVKINQNQYKNKSITPNDTFFELIPIKDLLKQIDIQTQYTKEIDGDYIIEDMEYYTILLPEKIMDGTKHKLYTRIVNALYFINNNISRSQILSYLFYVNNRANPGWDNRYLYNYITRLCDNIEQNGVRIKPRVKRIHFNKESNLTKKQKQIMGAKLNGKLRTNKTREIIQNAKYELGIRNIKITQKEVAEYTGMSIATIKRNWNLNKEEIVIDIPEDDVKDIIEEEKFFNDNQSINEDIVAKNEDMRVIEYIYKGFEKVTIIITKEDKEDFKNAIKRLENEKFEVCLSTLVLCGLDKYKLDYLYHIWIKNNPKVN